MLGFISRNLSQLFSNLFGWFIYIGVIKGEKDVYKMQLSKGWIVINEEWSIVKSVIFTTEHWYSVFYWSMYCHWYMYMLPTLRVKVWQMVIGKYIIMYIRKTHVVFLVFLFFFFCFISCTKYVPTYLRGLFENYCDIYSLSLWAKV